MDKKNNKDRLNLLTALDDESVEEISGQYPVLDKSAMKRIEKLCERKMNMKKDNIFNTNETDTVDGVEKYKKPSWYKRPEFAAAACFILLLGGVGFAVSKNIGHIDPADESSIGLTGINAPETSSSGDSADITDSTVNQPQDTSKYALTTAGSEDGTDAINTATATTSAVSDPKKDDTADFSRTEGTWRSGGAKDTAYIVMDGKGNYTAFYASGNTESTGTLKAVDENGNGYNRYDMYDSNGNLFSSLYFDSDSKFHIGSGDFYSYYIKDEANNAGSGSSDYSGIAAEIDDCATVLLGALDYIDEIGGGFIPKDETQTITINGVEYAKVVKTQFSSVADIQSFMEGCLTNSFINRRYAGILGGNEPWCIDNNGELYVKLSARGAGFHFTNEYNITVNSENEACIFASYDNYGTESIMRIDVVRDNGTWKINNISMEIDD